MSEQVLTLETSWSRRVNRNPSQELIAQAIQRLNSDDDFLILARSDQDYVQATPGAVEYRSDGRHYRCETESRDRKLMEKAFMAYYHGEPMNAALPWCDVTNEIKQEIRRNQATHLLFLIGGVILLALWIIRRR